ncbi:hypothetical protein Ate01nite_35880 [Actinoplanes teichomyceticus]|nr:hypothetical protein Ate01nite_35880 [Actinoplanes teichomyceticus]
MRVDGDVPDRIDGHALILPDAADAGAAGVDGGHRRTVTPKRQPDVDARPFVNLRLTA